MTERTGTQVPKLEPSRSEEGSTHGEGSPTRIRPDRRLDNAAAGRNAVYDGRCRQCPAVHERIASVGCLRDREASQAPSVDGEDRHRRRRTTGVDDDHDLFTAHTVYRSRVLELRQSAFGPPRLRSRLPKPDCKRARSRLNDEREPAQPLRATPPRDEDAVGPAVAVDVDVQLSRRLDDLVAAVERSDRAGAAARGRRVRHRRRGRDDNCRRHAHQRRLLDQLGCGTIRM